jgi:ribosomal protein L23
VNNLIALKPRISEKTYALSELTNTYVFVVPQSANKHDVARSIAQQFEVEVVSVRLSSTPGKTKRAIRRGGRSVFKGSRSDVRKAYVTLAEKDKLPIFSAVEEGTKPEETKSKKEKK